MNSDSDKIFADRRHAGVALGDALKARYRGKNAIVLAIPRGGVPVAAEVARMLQAELSVLVTRKLPHPGNPELAIGAAAEDGSVFLDSRGKEMSQSTVAAIIKEQQGEIERRIQRFRQGEPMPVMDSRVVILVDDGIATGATLMAAVRLCRRRNASRIALAVPVGSRRLNDDLTASVDDIHILVQPEDYHAVGQVYEDFHPLTDEEVVEALKDFQNHRLNYV